MKPELILSIIATSIAFSASAEIVTRSLRVSEFMLVPKSTWATSVVSASSNVTITEELSANGDMGFRVIHLRRSARASKQAAVDLAESGLIQQGDILLSFRPEWDNTLAYAHMQLGISHTALAFVVSEAGGAKFVHTLESPIDYSSPLNSPHHYTSLDAIHIVRTKLSEAQKSNLAKWARKILGSPTKFQFYTDYSKPIYARGIPTVTTPLDQIKLMAKVVLGEGSIETFCSEFVWTVLGLRDCDPVAYQPSCVKPIFGTDSGALTGLVTGLAGSAGLIQGPEAALVSAGKSSSDKTKELTERVFVDILTDPDQLSGKMSSGHRAVAEANSALMTVINRQYYGSGEPAQVAAGINGQVVQNFSPTSFMIRSNAKLDGFTYVGTIVFDR